MTARGLRIGLFGGAFDPVHIGHQQVVKSYLESNLIHKLHLLPTASPPHKKIKSTTSFHHRSQMLKLAFSEYAQVVVNEIENHLPKPSYTYQTIEYLQKKNPENIYYLCIGGDNLATFNEWFKYEFILKKVALIVAGRPGANIKKQQKNIIERSVFIDHKEIEISSTEIRNRENLNEIAEYVPEIIIDYIKRHDLYADQ